MIVMAELLDAGNKRFSSFGDRSKSIGSTAMDKSAVLLDERIMIRCLGAWRCEARVNGVLRNYARKVEAKRQQLVGVQHMFRSFANDLESGTTPGLSARREDTKEAMWNRPKSGHRKLSGRGLVRSEGALPGLSAEKKSNSGSVAVDNRHHGEYRSDRDERNVCVPAPDRRQGGDDRHREYRSPRRDGAHDRPAHDDRCSGSVHEGRSLDSALLGHAVGRQAEARAARPSSASNISSKERGPQRPGTELEAQRQAQQHSKPTPSTFAADVDAHGPIAPRSAWAWG